MVVSAPEDADLLDASSWTISNQLAFDPAWVPASLGEFDNPGFLEGNMVQMPDGLLVNVLRFNWDPCLDKAVIVNVSPDGKTLSFDPSTGFIDFPGGHSKFVIRRDPVTGLYLTLSNELAQDKPSWRNRLCLCVSKDVRHWKTVKVLLEDDLDLPPEEALNTVGFQYIDWQFDDEDLIYASRTSYKPEVSTAEGLNSTAHNSNRITFHRLNHFRDDLKLKVAMGN